MLLAPQQYKSQVELLRKRFVEKESTNYLLKDALPNSVAADGLELYMKTIWVRNIKALQFVDAKLLLDRRPSGPMRI